MTETFIPICAQCTNYRFLNHACRPPEHGLRTLSFSFTHTDALHLSQADDEHRTRPLERHIAIYAPAAERTLLTKNAADGGDLGGARRVNMLLTECERS
jgi:hypothetical protein